MGEGSGQSGDCSTFRYSRIWYGGVARAEIINEYGRFAVGEEVLGIRGIVRRFVAVENGIAKLPE